MLINNFDVTIRPMTYTYYPQPLREHEMRIASCYLQNVERSKVTNSI